VVLGVAQNLDESAHGEMVARAPYALLLTRYPWAKMPLDVQRPDPRVPVDPVWTPIFFGYGALMRVAGFSVERMILFGIIGQVLSVAQQCARPREDHEPLAAEVSLNFLVQGLGWWLVDVLLGVGFVNEKGTKALSVVSNSKTVPPVVKRGRR